MQGCGKYECHADENYMDRWLGMLDVISEVATRLRSGVSCHKIPSSKCAICAQSTSRVLASKLRSTMAESRICDTIGPIIIICHTHPAARISLISSIKSRSVRTAAFLLMPELRTPWHLIRCRCQLLEWRGGQQASFTKKLLFHSLLAKTVMSRNKD